MKKIVLTESDRKKIISEREKAIVESFAKTFNKIKRLDESDVNESKYDRSNLDPSHPLYGASDEELDTVAHAMKKENEVIDEGLLTEDRIDDFFTFLAKDPNNKSMASAYYTAPVTMNKTIIGDDGIKIPNPMYGKLFKNTRFMFRWGDVYKDAVERVNPEHEFGERRGTYDKVEGFKVTEMGKSGLYLPILPTGSEANYSIMENGQWSVIDKNEVRKYLPPYRGSSASGVEYRQLIVDRIAMIKSGGNEWVNLHFKFKYLGPGKIE